MSIIQDIVVVAVVVTIMNFNSNTVELKVTTIQGYITISDPFAARSNIITLAVMFHFILECFVCLMVSKGHWIYQVLPRIRN